MINLKELREKNRLSLDEISEQTNLPVTYLEEVEAGEKELSVKAFERILAFIEQDGVLSLDSSQISVSGLGDKIRALRKEKGISLEDMGHHLGLSLSYLSEVERGRRVPSLESLHHICRFFNIPVSLLVTSSSKVRVTGEKIRLNRETKGISQKHLAQMAGLSSGLVSQLEAAKVQPSLKTIESIANALDVSVCYLILEQEDVEGYLAAVTPEMREMLYDPRVQMLIGHVCALPEEDIRLVFDFIKMLKERNQE